MSEPTGTDNARDKAVMEAADHLLKGARYASDRDAIRLIMRDRARLAERCERQARVVEAARSAWTTCHHQRAGKLLKVALDTLDAPRCGGIGGE